jgi:parvulin-like peptidyl-prolyl isomerase
MAMMAKMRSLAPAFIVTVGALFVLFMVMSDSNVLQAIGGRSNNVGSVNGEDITYPEFMKVLDQQRENQKAQTGRDIEDDQMDQFREQIWNAIVTQKLIQQQIKKYGITVSDQEIRDAILGPNPPAFLKQNFVDSTGNFNRSLYEQALFDPRNKQALVQAEEYVRQQRLNEKLQSLLYATVNISEADIKRSFIDQNISINSEYALVDINQIPDNEVKVTDNDLKAYYDKNTNKYKVEAQRKIKYVLFANKASQEDSSSVKKSLEQILSNYGKDTSSFKEVVETYSALSVRKDTITPSGLSEEVLARLSKASKGSIVGPIATPQGMAVYHLLDVVPSSDTYVRASHILINQYGSDEKNLEEANKLYDQLVKGASFEKLAKEKSQSPEGQSNGGDLGWFGKGMMVPEFENAAMSGAVGVIQKPVKTQFGYHIIKTTGKISNKFAVEWVISPLKPSQSTIDANMNNASDFAYLANKNSFESEAKGYHYTVLESPAFAKDAVVIQGVGANKRLVDYAFENSVGAISDKPFKVPQGYIVAKVSSASDDRVRPFEEVKGLIKPLAVREKKYEKAKAIAERISKQMNGNLASAPGLAKYVTYSQTGAFTPGSTVPTVGRDFAYIEKSLSLPINKISEPVKGQRGYYLLKVTSRTQFDKTAYGIQRNMLRDNLLREKKSNYFNEWLAKLKKDANIKDNRYVFFGQ